MNSRGQSLVLFIIFLPIVVLLFIYLFDIANVLVEKIKLEDISNQAINYINEGKNIELVKNYILKNDSEVKIVSINENEVYLIKKVPSLFGTNLGFKKYELKIKAEG